MEHFETGTIHNTMTLPRLVKMIEENTNGRVKITLYEAGSLVPAMELLTACGDDVIQLFTAPGSYWGNTIPVGIVENALPGSFRDGNEYNTWVLDYGVGELIRKEYAKHNVYWLGLPPSSPQGQGIILTKPASSLADLKGRKIRTYGLFMTFLTKLGMAPVSIPLPETYTALATGVADGVCSAYTPLRDFKFYEVCKYGLLPPFTGEASWSVSMNLDAWKSLPDDLQLLVTLTFSDWTFWMTRWHILNWHPLSDMQAKGLQVTTLSEADQAKVQEVSMQIWDELTAKDAAAAEAIATMKKLFKDIGRIK